MAGPRITRLNDPANPYNQKKTPTSAPSLKQQATNRAVSQRAAVAPKPKPVARTANPAVQPAMKQAQGGYAARQNAKIDKALQGSK